MRLRAGILAAALLAWSCSSQQQDQPELDTSKEDGEDEESEDDGEEAADKQPISDDGYDDDWNNMGSQQQKQAQQQQQKNDQGEGGLEDEPPLQNAPQAQQQAPIQDEPFPEQPVAEIEPMPIEEPPLDAEPAPIAEAEPPPPPPAPVETEVPPVISGPPLVRQDLKPVYAQLVWVGYDYVERDGLVRIEMVTRGSPRFNIFQERNQADQPELVVRFFQTVLRDKVRRDIDASEFRSPVAFVRMRIDEEEQTVDVVMTMRDAVQPRLFSKSGDVLLTFALPDHYFGNATIGQAPIAKAEVLPNANVMPLLDEGADQPEGLKVAKAFVNNPAELAFKDAPPDGGEPIAPEDGAALPTEMEPLPTNFAGNANMAQGTNMTNIAANVGNTNLNFGNVNANANASGEGDFGDDLDFEGGGDELDGEPGNFDAAGFGANQAVPAGDLNPNVQGAQGFEDDEGGDDVLDDDSLDDFDGGDGNSQQEIDKFDVRLRRALPYLAAATLALPAAAAPQEIAFSVAGVAQDDFGAEDEEGGFGGDDEGFGIPNQQQAQGGNENAFGNGNANLGNQNGGNANFGGNGNFGNANLGNANVGNANVGNGNFGNGATNANLNAEANANFPAANTAFGNGNTSGMQAAAPNEVPFANDAVFAEEPAVEGAPDLAGEEQVGADTDVAPQPSAGGRPIRLDFRGAPLNEVIRALGDESGVNFVFPPDIGQKPIYVNLNGVPFNDALRALLESNALGMVEVSPNIVRIDTLERIAADKENEEKRRKAELKLRPTKVLVHRLSYAKAEEAAKMLAEMLGAAAKEDARIAVQTDLRTNAVIVNAPASDLAMVKALLERIDLETPQVKIASRIVEVQKKFSDAFGVSWSTPFNFDQGRGLGFGNLTFPNYMLSRYSVDAGGLNPSTANLGFRFGSINNALALDVALSMQEERGTLEILQSSNLIVEDNAEAEIVAGSSDFFRMVGARANGNQQEDLAEVTYNLTMKVKPHITADGAVQMKLTIESDSPAPPASTGGGALAAKNNRAINTSLLRRSGETAVIGGVYNTSTQRKETGVPFFSRIPIIGALFRSQSTIEEKRELLVMVTPTIINGGKGFGGEDTAGDVASNVGGDFGGNVGGGNDFGNNGLNSEQQQNDQSQGNFGNEVNFGGNQQQNQGGQQNQQNAQEQNEEDDE